MKQKIKYDISLKYIKLFYNDMPITGVITDKGNVYIIQNSEDNFFRFRKWIGLKSVADIQLGDKKFNKVNDSKGTIYKNVPGIFLRTEVEYETKRDA